MKNYWNIALSLSLVLHVAIFTEFSQSLHKTLTTEKPAEKKEKTKEIKIVPEKIEKITKKEVSTPVNTAPPVYTENILSKLIENDNFSPLEKPQIFEKNIKEIIFSQISENNKSLKKNPAYMSYYRLIREKIRASAYQNYTTTKKGEVIVNFMILNNGTLQKININPGSVSSRILRSIALKSVEESAPFPAFPAELSKYSQLQFNISIYFKSN